MENENPYRAPDLCADDSLCAQPTNVLGRIGLGLAVLGLCPVAIIPLLSVTIPCQKAFDPLWYVYIGIQE